jgi:hypothetical protein
MVDHPFKERMRIHQRLDIEKRSDIELTPFGVNSLKFPCLPHPGISFHRTETLSIAKNHE